FQYDIMPPVFGAVSSEHSAMLRLLPAFAGVFASVCAVLQFGDVRRWKVYFALLLLLQLFFFAASFNVDRRWTPEETLATISNPLTMAVAAVVVAAMTTSPASSEHCRRTWHWLAVIAALSPLAWFGLWWHLGFAELRTPFVIVLE